MTDHRPIALACPLDWGLGHASRLVPVIRNLISEGFRVVLAADRLPLALLRKEFPELEWLRFPSLRVRYPASLPLLLYMLFFLPVFFLGFFRERRYLNKILRTLPVSLVISDNRYGLTNRKTYNVILTHQLMIPMPRGLRWAEPLVSGILYRLVSSFDACWIPDHAAEPSLSGALSHTGPLPVRAFFIGPLSRLEAPVIKSDPSIDLLLLLSGPEPQRSLLERKLLADPALAGKKVALVRGVEASALPAPADPSVKQFNLLSSEELASLLQKTEVVVCRAGYSTIMELVRCRKRAVLIPTPGQPEQEYLASHLYSTGAFVTINQESLDLGRALTEVPFTDPGIPDLESDALEKAVSSLAVQLVPPKEDQSGEHADKTQDES